MSTHFPPLFKHRLGYALVGLLMVVVFNACNRAETNPKPQVLGPSTAVLETDPEEILFDRMIETAAYGLADPSRNPVVRNVLNALVSKRFDGDDNALLCQLSDSLAVHNINLCSIMRASLQAHGHSGLTQYVEGAVKGFLYGEDSIYLQVYIPFIDLIDRSVSPVIALNPNGDSVLRGFSVGTEGIEEVTIGLQEAMGDLIWVISGNETIPVTSHSKWDQGPSNGPKPAGPDDIHLALHEIYITDQKENWANGRADLAYTGGQMYTSICQLDVSYDASNTYCKLNQSDMSTWFNPNYCPEAMDLAGGPILGSGNEDNYWITTYEKLHIVLFERDLRKKFGQAPQLFSGCPNEFYFRSKESPYGYIEFNPADYTISKSVFLLNSELGVKEYSLYGGKFRFEGYRAQ